MNDSPNTTTRSQPEPLVLCLSSEVKGAEFFRECKRRGWRTMLLAPTEFQHDTDWAWDAIDDSFFMPSLYNTEHVVNAVSWLARSRTFDLVVALHDLDVEGAAALREHMRLPGMNISTARYFRDKLAMRVRSRDAGIAVPDFVHVLNYDALRDYMARVPGPWLLKPRWEAGALGIRRINDAEELWRALDELGDAQSHFLMERFVYGDICHVDSIVANGKVVFAEAHRYGRPLLDVVQHGSTFTTRTVPRGTDAERTMKDINQRVLGALGLRDGVAHTELIDGNDGTVYFLETAARAGGANIVEVIEASTGINLWAEWAKLETAAPGTRYKLPKHRQDAAGIVISLARQEWPDMSGYTDPEIVWRIDKRYHAGMIVASPDAERVDSLITEYSRRFVHDFTAVLPPEESAHH